LDENDGTDDEDGTTLAGRCLAALDNLDNVDSKRVLE
jgi:hypothetical protein